MCLRHRFDRRRRCIDTHHPTEKGKLLARGKDTAFGIASPNLAKERPELQFLEDFGDAIPVEILGAAGFQIEFKRHVGDNLRQPVAE